MEVQVFQLVIRVALAVVDLVQEAMVLVILVIPHLVALMGH
jgi:hypothetical protein